MLNINLCNYMRRAEAKKIFVGGLPTEVTEKEFADYFGTFGLVKVFIQCHDGTVCNTCSQYFLS